MSGRGAAALYVAAAYGALLVAAVLAGGILAAWHTGLVNLYMAMRWGIWGFDAYVVILSILLVVAWITAITVFEHLFVKAGDFARLRRRALPIVLVESVVLALSVAVVWGPGRVVLL